MLKQLLILFVLLVFQKGFSHTNPPLRKDISVMIAEAGSYLIKLECDKSLDLAKKALGQAYRIKNYELVCKAYNIIGLNFEELSDYKKSIQFYNKGLVYANTISNDTLKYWLHNNLGNVYCYQKINFQKGLEHYKKGLYYSNKIHKPIEIMYCNLNIARAYFDVKDFNKGLPFLKKAEKIATNSEELEAKILLYSLLGSYHTYKNNFEKAELHFVKALQLCNIEKSDYLEINTSEVYKDFSKLYLKTNDYQNAYFYLNKYQELKNKIYSDKRSKAINTAGLNVELEEYKRQIDKIESEKFAQKINLQQSKIVLFLFTLVSIVLLLLLYTLNKNNRFKKKINNELTIANQELKIAVEKAEEASKIKTQFVSTISHELRTPLYGVVGITNMILDEHKELRNSPYINSLKFSAKYLLSLVNDILQINKMEENKIVLENLTFNISDELNNVLSSLQFLANKNNNKLKYEIDTAIPEFLIGDKFRLSQILMNLVSNSLKFTKNGKVFIHIELVKVVGKINHIKFQIKDNGIGIALEDQDIVFEKFVQVDRKEDDYQGTGLGLSIVKRLIELFGSTINIKSKKGEGTTLSFTIGFEMDLLKSNQIITDYEVDLTSSQIFNILVVEDNKINHMVTKKIIEKNNYKCQVVDDGLIALKLLKKENFDVILMDLNMPIINGFETSRKIREIGINTPIVALTAFAKEEVIDDIIASGMNDIIIKPFEPIKLFQTICNQINKSKLSQ